MKKISPENSIWNTAVPLLSYSCMFQVEICSQQLEICKSVCIIIVLTIVLETDYLSVVLFRWLPIMTSWRKDKQSWMLRQARTHSRLWLFRNLSVSCRVNQFCFAIILMWYTRNIYIFFFINSSVRMSDNLPEMSSNLGSRAYHLHYCPRRQNYLLSNIMQLILVKIKWHIK